MPRRHLPIRWPLLLAITALIALAAAYIFGLSAYQASGNSLYEPSDLYIPRAIDVVVVVWCLWVGSAIGSFLNVVAWRMPRHESINGRSHCPRCRSQLKARDNFPIFGWLALRGRCRTCHLPIAARYPIVEATVGLSITLISIGELYHLSLPGQAVHWHGGPLWVPRVNGQVLVTLLYHVVGLAVAWGFGLIRMDKHRLPGRLIGFGVFAAVVPMLAYPTLMVVPWQMHVPYDWWPDGRYLDALLRVITSLAAATLLGRTLARGLCPAADPKLDPLSSSTARLMDLVVILALPIILVGWQASPAVVVMASLIAVALKSCLPTTCDCLGRFAIAMPLALTTQIFIWRWLHAVVIWPSVGSSPWVILGWSAVALMVPMWLREPAAKQHVEPMKPWGSEENEDSGAGDDEESDDEESDDEENHGDHQGGENASEDVDSTGSGKTGSGNNENASSAE